MKSRQSLKLFFHSLLLAVLFFGLVQMIASSKGRFASLELAGLLFLLLLSVAGLATYNTKGVNLLYLVFLLLLVDLMLIWYFYDSLFVVLILAALIGLLTSF